ncbi:hypothetical protein [Nonomuraea jiangxiensis]|uniref:WD40-like Beta Propeller Repeat n=1 Tax=Nonomuraea jiangxiensis TaxID=633440 RepID=A0A1G9CL09_9ACTN|nr:hypothetical protein [Nonomuraea jiangxiensis]SDK52302.1 hypothetical protein SAMN05421869_116200 [Nonomuraea jiangxiensis]
MGDVVFRVLAAVVPVACLSFAVPAHAADEGTRRLFTFKDPKITESSGLAVSPTHDGIYYTHNDSAAAPTFYAVDGSGRTKATFQVSGAEARDWEAMAATKDAATGRGVLWFADIGDNLDGAWPDVSIYKVLEPRTVASATLPATRYRFRYADGARNAEGIMINPKTGRLYVVSKEFAGSVYAAPKKLRTDRVNVLRRVTAAPLMATDAAYAPDGSSYVVRTYFSATLYQPSGKMISRVEMPELQQAESITYTRDGKALLTGSEGVKSPVYRVPLPERARPTPTPSPVARSATPSPVAADTGGTSGLTVTNVLIWLAAAAIAVGGITFLARRTR